MILFNSNKKVMINIWSIMKSMKMFASSNIKCLTVLSMDVVKIMMILISDYLLQLFFIFPH